MDTPKVIFIYIVAILSRLILIKTIINNLSSNIVLMHTNTAPKNYFPSLPFSVTYKTTLFTGSVGGAGAHPAT